MTRYAVKISEQGQITLPKALRQKIGAKTGTRVVLVVNNDENGEIVVSTDYPINKYFGSLGHSITDGKDAATYIRNVRDADIANRENKI